MVMLRVALTVLLLTGCAAVEAPESVGAGPSASEESQTPDSAWIEPDTYEFTLSVSCGLFALNGAFGLVVDGGDVVAVEPLDDQAREHVEYEGETPPTIGELLDLVGRARSDGADVVEVVVAQDGTPSEINIDYSTETEDDERCFTIRDLTPLDGRPDPEATGP